MDSCCIHRVLCIFRFMHTALRCGVYPTAKKTSHFGRKPELLVTEFYYKVYLALNTVQRPNYGLLFQDNGHFYQNSHTVIDHIRIVGRYKRTICWKPFQQSVNKIYYVIKVQRNITRIKFLHFLITTIKSIVHECMY